MEHEFKQLSAEDIVIANTAIQNNPRIPGKFILFTTIGAGGWHSVLALLGWYLHAIVPEDQLNDKISEYAEYIKFIILGLIVLAVIYFVIKRKLNNKQEKSA